MDPRPLYKAIAATLATMQFCSDRNLGADVITGHRNKLDQYLAYLPNGSGFDAGCTLNESRSTPENLVFNADFHHLDDVGDYIGWSRHQVIVVPSLVDDIAIRVTGRNQNHIKDHIADTFHAVLTRLVS